MIRPYQRGLILGVGLLLLLLGGNDRADAQTSGQGSEFSPSEVEAIEQVVREYLIANPEVILDAINELEKRQNLAEESRQREAVANNQVALTSDPNSPVLGNPEGDVVLVEFFDYRCPYCRKVAEDIIEVVEEDGRIRLVMKEYPILGPESVFAAKAALAAAKQGLYQEFHLELMTIGGGITEESTLATARQLGLDMEQLQQDMDSPEVMQAIRDVHELAGALAIRGTPAFVIHDQVVPGALSMDQLRQLVNDARAGAS